MAKTKGKYTTNICGKRVKLARVEAGLNQLELATLLSEDFDLRVDQNSISRIEKGERFVKDYELLVFAEALNKHPMWILYGDKIPVKFK